MSKKTFNLITGIIGGVEMLALLLQVPQPSKFVISS